MSITDATSNYRTLSGLAPDCHGGRSGVKSLSMKLTSAGWLKPGNNVARATVMLRLRGQPERQHHLALIELRCQNREAVDSDAEEG